MDLKYAMLFALLLVPLASAIGGNPAAGGAFGVQGNGSPRAGMGELKEELLDSSMDNVVCKADFMVAVLESVMENVNGTESLQDDVDALEDDVAALEAYSDSGDGLNFRQYLHGSFAPHMRTARLNIMSARMGAGSAARQQMRADYESFRADYESCNLESLQRFSQAKLDSYEAVLERAQERADNLSAKGVDTGGLDSLIDDAREQIVEPLEDALSDAQNGTDIRDALGEYCLFNGCKEGTNFHFWLKFEAEKLDSLLAFISPDAEEAGLSDDVAEAQSHIDSAKDALDEVGASQYADGVEKDIIDDLREAAQAIKEILRELRSA